MGVKFFYKWLQTNFEQYVKYIKKDVNINSGIFKVEDNHRIDHFLIDMNGLIHASAQKIYQYGDCKKNRPLLGAPKKNIDRDNLVFKDLSQSIESLVKTVNPQKQLVLCVDGSAPLGKQNQQRQRRFRAALEITEDSPFNSSSITPGTIFMEKLTLFLEQYIEMKIKNEWKELRVVFSGSNVPGEGEAKCLEYIRKYIDRKDSYCVYANDADLIMLTMLTHLKRIYVIRDSLYDNRYLYHLLDIQKISEELLKNLEFSPEEGVKPFNKVRAIDDFIFLCFLVGNDFLPNIPSMEIIESGIEILFGLYKTVGKSYGHILFKGKNGLVIRKKPLQQILDGFGKYEREILERKNAKGNFYFEDTNLSKSIITSNGKRILDMKKYKTLYYSNKLGIAHQDFEMMIPKICIDYIKGMQWTISYYSRGIPDWHWFYNYNYAPFASDIAEYMSNYTLPEFEKGEPIPPLLQLSIVLPPKSYSLLPDIFRDNKKIHEYCPEEFNIDLSGKRREWEGIPVLPCIDIEKYIENYKEKLGKLSISELERNKFGKSFIYENGEKNEINI